MSRTDPAWLPEARDLCRSAGISIVGWGPEALTVEAKSAARAGEIAAQFAQLGFRPMADEDDESAGLLTLSRTAGLAVQPQAPARNVDLTRRPFLDLLTPPFELLLSLASLWYNRTEPQPRATLGLVLGFVLLLMFFWDVFRMWGWKMDMSGEGLRIRRYFKWTEVSWNDIHSVDTVNAGRYRELVILRASGRPELNLGRFPIPFARALRDGLRARISGSRGHAATS